MIMISAIASLGFGALSKGIDSAFNGNATNEAYNRQRQLMREQNDLAVQNWLRENNYNTPTRVKQRLLDAGLNPDLMYGQGGLTSMQSDISAPSAPSAPMTNMGTTNLAQDSAALGLASAQVKNLGADTEHKVIENSFLAQTIQANLENVIANTELTKENKKEVTERIPIYAQQIATIVQDRDLAIKRFGLDTYLACLQGVQTYADAWLKTVQADDIVKTQYSRIFQAMASGNLASAQSLFAQIITNPSKFKNIVEEWKKLLFKPGVMEDIGKSLEKRQDLKGYKNKDGSYDIIRMIFMGLNSLLWF